ncbi:nucleotide cyclase [Baffinella frigidus]|nr:nucleotide cyclase [Cryptophyta sp. CCMP2293]
MQERTQWRAVELLLVEGRQVGRMLEDLLPRAVADEIVSSGAHNCHNLHVVILQLDLRGYTGLAMSMTSTELAAVIHSLFSEFDDEVVARKVFKMDTIGDCYIVLAVIPPEGQGPARGSVRATCVKMRFSLAEKMGPARGSARATCVKMRFLAEKMIAIMRSLAEKMIGIVSRPRGSRDKPLRLSSRVGFAVGHVVAGVIGRLQPRYHCVGKVMEEVMKLEGGSSHHGFRVMEEVMRLEGGSMINAVNLSLEQFHLER